ncbi:hypothetical protein cgp_0493 [Corynebacterium glutamicum MB001]|nr:hypothetical protein cgp_0493 [Corynebacterium glutamicum MB001]ASW13199.1 hypothetical protein cgc1_0493 [Corynebacterium glutamicum]QYO72661.1 hypothetical protein cgisf_0493 [Corynebacterium glutamicum]CAF19129.1 hypothetical protein predicted by Glimmer [Corynebacterium glutamicum ATCC 13032]SJM54023.1 hypothetical protein FM102_05085 [Corynebacterium glutamicum]
MPAHTLGNAIADTSDGVARGLDFCSRSESALRQKVLAGFVRTTSI